MKMETMLEKIDIIYLSPQSRRVFNKRCLLVDSAADAKFNLFQFNTKTKTWPLKKYFF